jgi:aminoglycoside phosphotransferase (APT) family kinase protein
VANDRASDLLLNDRPSVLTFWRDDLGRTDDPATVEFLSGGVSSAVIRVVTPEGTFIVKQALPRLRVAEAWYSRPERSLIESRCAMVLAELVPGSVPQVVATAPQRNAFVMESAPRGSETWKAHLMRGEVVLTDAAMVGRLLGTIHARSAGRADLAGEFDDQSFFDELRLDPYLRFVARRAPELAPAIGDVVDELLEIRRCLVHGDFSPKNLLLPPGGGVLLVDHEVAHWGHPAFDVAFVLSHLCLKAIRFRVTSAAYLDAGRAVIEAYAEAAGGRTIATGHFAARLTGALMLARVDGKSPVEYLTEPRDRDLARRLGRDALLEPTVDAPAFMKTVGTALLDESAFP